MTLEIWEHMLDEYALNPDPMTWHKVTGLRFTIDKQFEAVQELLRRGYLKWSGVTREEWKDTLYAITPEGMAYWVEHIRGKRTRPKTADPLPRWSTAKLAAAQSPVWVFDLPRVPWRWDKKGEQKRMFGECER